MNDVYPLAPVTAAVSTVATVAAMAAMATMATMAAMATIVVSAVVGLRVNHARRIVDRRGVDRTWCIVNRGRRVISIGRRGIINGGWRGGVDHRCRERKANVNAHRDTTGMSDRRHRNATGDQQCEAGNN